MSHFLYLLYTVLTRVELYVRPDSNAEILLSRINLAPLNDYLWTRSLNLKAAHILSKTFPVHISTLRYFTATFPNVYWKYCQLESGCWNLYSLRLFLDLPNYLATFHVMVVNEMQVLLRQEHVLQPNSDLLRNYRINLKALLSFAQNGPLFGTKLEGLRKKWAKEINVQFKYASSTTADCHADKDDISHYGVLYFVIVNSRYRKVDEITTNSPVYILHNGITRHNEPNYICQDVHYSIFNKEIRKRPFFLSLILLIGNFSIHFTLSSLIALTFSYPKFVCFFVPIFTHIS